MFIKIVFCIAILSGAFSTQNSTIYNGAVEQVETELKIPLPYTISLGLSNEEAYKRHKENIQAIYDYAKKLEAKKLEAIEKNIDLEGE